MAAPPTGARNVLVRRVISPVPILMSLLMAAALAVRFAFFNDVAYLTVDPRFPPTDSMIWMIWSKLIWQHGLDHIDVVTPKTYLGYHYVFWAVGLIYAQISADFKVSNTLLYLLKVPPVICDLLLAPLVFMTTRRVAALLPDARATASRLPVLRTLERHGLPADDAIGIAAAAIVLFSPAVIYDSAVWAQSESVISVLMLAAILLLVTGRIGPAWFIWAIAFVVKPQPLVIVPALAAFTYWRFGSLATLRAAVGAGTGAFAMLAYFIFTGNGGYIIDVYRELFRTYNDHISINAWNLWWPGYVQGVHASDTVVRIGAVHLTASQTSFLLLVCTTANILLYLYLRRDLIGLLTSCAMLEFSFYLFPISTHERYLYPFFIFLAPIVFLRPRWLLLYVPLSAMFFLNIFLACPSDPDLLGKYLQSPLSLTIASLNVCTFFVTLIALVASALQSQQRLHFPRLRPARAVPAVS